MPDTPAVETFHWQHPRLGRITEYACSRHSAEILRSLRTLGIGCGGTEAPPGADCHRCVHPARPFSWLPGLASGSESDPLVLMRLRALVRDFPADRIPQVPLSDLADILDGKVPVQ